MGDINLLPEDLRKKEEKILKNKDVFYDNIEYTGASKLEQDGPSINTSKMDTPFDSRKMETSAAKDFQAPLKEDDLQKEKIYSKPIVEKKIVVDNQNQKSQGAVKPKTSFINILNKLDSIFKSKKEKNNKLGINLIPESSRIPSNKVLFFMFFYPLIIVSVIVVVSYFGLKYYNLQIQKDIKDLEKQITDTIDSAGDYNKLILELEDWQNKTRNIKNLLTKHVYWTEFFRKLEDNTLKGVRFSNFSGNIQGNLTFLASAPNYETVVRQWMHLKRANKFVNNVIISGAALSTSKENPNGVSFSVTLDLVDNIFYKTE